MGGIMNADTDTKNEEYGFLITSHKGVRMRFANGWAISVQWGPGNYCEGGRIDYDGDFLAQHRAPKHADSWPSITAEIAIFSPNGEFFRPDMKEWDSMDDVLGWQTPDQVARWIAWTAARPANAATNKEPGVKK